MRPEYLHRSGSPPYTALRLPHGLDGEISGFDFSQADNSAEFLISLLEELRVESEETKQFQIFSEKLLLEAWRDGRLFGLSMEVTENMLVEQEKTREFTINFGQMLAQAPTRRTDWVLPCFLVTAPPRSFDEYNDTIELFWVAERLRMCGLGARLDFEYGCEYVHRPLAEVDDFWYKLGYTLKQSPPTSSKKTILKKRKITFADPPAHERLIPSCSLA